jgi:hypothetical protein
LLFLDEFDGLYKCFKELQNNPFGNGLDNDQYQCFLGPPPSHILRAFVKLNVEELSIEDTYTSDLNQTPLIQIYALWRSLIGRLHIFFCDTFAFLESPVVSDATAAAAARER